VRSTELGAIHRTAGRISFVQQENRLFAPPERHYARSARAVRRDGLADRPTEMPKMSVAVSFEDEVGNL
jgi:hypothetical protein